MKDIKIGLWWLLKTSFIIHKFCFVEKLRFIILWIMNRHTSKWIGEKCLWNCCIRSSNVQIFSNEQSEVIRIYFWIKLFPQYFAYFCMFLNCLIAEIGKNFIPQGNLKIVVFLLKTKVSSSPLVSDCISSLPS